MKKGKATPKPYTTETSVSANPPTVQEPYISYPKLVRVQPAVADFSFKRFQKIASKIPFSLNEWAGILHLSERTLQRYAKDNKNFEGIYVDRILQIEKIINLGLQVFSSPEELYNWLKAPKEVLGETLDFNSLSTSDGISQVLDQLGRIQQGVYA